jgi:hypothetical protein
MSPQPGCLVHPRYHIWEAQGSPPLDPWLSVPPSRMVWLCPYRPIVAEWNEIHKKESGYLLFFC